MYRIKAVSTVLQGICCNFVCESNATAFLLQVDDDAPALCFQLGKRSVELHFAVAPLGA